MFDDRRPAFLSLRDLTPDRAAVRRLPLDGARRYRALPIAQDSGCITVAMADPSDLPARAAVTAALVTDGSLQVYMVQGDPALIDAWLADLAQADAYGAGQPEAQPLEIWLREPLYGDKAAVTGYAAQIAALLATPLRRFDPLAAGQGWPPCAALPVHRLVILPCIDYNLPSPLQANGNGGGPSSGRGDPAPTLYACRPRWPLRRLLLIVRGGPVDDTALTWATRLARASGATATALMVAPHTPASHAPWAHDDISSLLSASNAIGHKMRHAAQRLAAMQLDAVLHLRQGAPEVVIREELATTSYDLVIGGVAVQGSDVQWRLRPLLRGLLPDLACPMLLATGVASSASAR